MHIIIRFPEPIEVIFSLTAPLPARVWVILISLLLTITATLMLITCFYQQLSFKCKNDPWEIFCRTMLGFTEPPADARFFVRGSAGSIVGLLFAVLIFYFNIFYNAELRSKIIGQRFPETPEDIRDLDIKNGELGLVTEGARLGLEEKPHLLHLWLDNLPASRKCRSFLDNDKPQKFDVSLRSTVGHTIGLFIQQRNKMAEYRCFIEEEIWKKNETGAVLMTRGEYDWYASYWKKHCINVGKTPKWCERGFGAQRSSKPAMSYQYLYIMNEHSTADESVSMAVLKVSVRITVKSRFNEWPL